MLTMRGALGVAVLLMTPTFGGLGCDRNPRSVPIRIGQTIEGRLESGDWTDVFADGSYTDLFEVTIGAGQGITVEMSSTELDTYISLLRGPGDQLVDNDDISPEDRNSRFTYAPQTAGTYFIAATSFRSGATGAYTLRVTPSDSRTGVESDKTSDKTR